MAILKWSGIGAVAASGKIQGTVFLVNNVARVWHKTKTVRDASTNYVKGIFSGIAAAYKTLTPAELLSWSNAVPNYLRKNALGEIRTLTASQAFQRVNNVLTSLGLVTTNDAPGVAVTDSITILVPAAADVANTFGLTITTFNGAVTLPANTFAKVFATPQFTASKQKFSKSNYREIGIYTPTTSINPLNIQTEYAAMFGAPIVGQRIGVAVELVYATPATTNLFKLNQRIYADCIVAA